MSIFGLSFLIACLLCVQGGRANINASTSGVLHLYRTMVSCSENDMISCLKKRAINVLENASNVHILPIWGDTLALVKSPERNISAVNSNNSRSIGESLVEFIANRRIQLTFPQFSYFVEFNEGRGKKNKGYGLVAMTIAGAMLAGGMSMLAALAGKALAASMAALAIAMLAALRQNGGGHGGGHSSYDVISIPSPTHHRSFLEKQQMSYSPYAYDSESHAVNERKFATA